MRDYNPSDRKDKIDAITLRYVTGEISESVYIASLTIYRLDRDEIRHLVMMNQLCHRNSTPFKQGRLPS